MRAINLLPADARRLSTPGGLQVGSVGPLHFVLAALVIALAYVTVAVLTNNTIAQRHSQLVAVQQQLTQEHAVIARFTAYSQFATLAQQRAATVRQIAAGRFDWHGALSDLSKVMPADAAFQSVVATVAPGVGVSGPGGGGSVNVRSAIDAPAFELKGCAGSQDEVARLMSRLRVINGVQRVTLEDSAKVGGSSAAGASGGSGQQGCSSDGPAFDMVVFFEPQATAAGSSTSGSPSPTTPAGAAASASQVSNPSSSTGSSK